MSQGRSTRRNTSCISESARGTIARRQATDAELPLLEPNIEEQGLAALLEIELPLGFVVEWSLNRYGTDREHISCGYVFGRGTSPRRRGAWMEAGVVP